jgi:hypothetical protein
MIISDRGAQFIARLWEQLQYALGTKLIRSSTYHPQTDGQTERINQILEDMLRACTLQYDKNWDKCLSLEKFSYNNSYQASIKMAPFEALYGRRCRTPLSWSQTGERKIFGPDIVTEAEEKVKDIQTNLKAAQSRQKSYADIRRRPLQFQIGDFVYLRVSPTRGVQRFGVKGKLAPRYVGPFEIIKILLSVKTHRRAATGNTRSREASGAAGGPRSLSQRPRIWHTSGFWNLPGVPPDLYLIRKVRTCF